MELTKDEKGGKGEMLLKENPNLNDKFRHLAGLQYLKDIEFASPKAGDVLVMEVK